MTALTSRELLADRLRAQLSNLDFPLSSAQQRVWFLSELVPDSAVYNIAFEYRLAGELNTLALEYALNEVIRRHEVLRSAIVTFEHGPVQVVTPQRPLRLVVVDLCHFDDPLAEASRLAGVEAKTPFDLKSGSMLRAQVLQIGLRDHLLLLTVHHIASDAWSMNIIGREISTYYRKYLAGDHGQLPPLSLQYGDYADWHKGSLSTERRAELVAFWRDRLSGAAACIELPTDRSRGPVQRYEGANVTVQFPQSVVTAIETTARRLGASNFAVLMSGFSALLQRYVGTDDLLIGTPVANRSDGRLDGVVGLFANTIILRPPVLSCRSFAELVAAVSRDLMEGLACQELPFEALVEDLQPERNAAHSPIFQVMFLYWDQNHDDAWDIPACIVTSDLGDTGTAKCDLTLSVATTTSGLRVRFEYSTALYDESTIKRMAAQFGKLLESALAKPDDELASLECLPAAERQLVLRDWAMAPALVDNIHLVHDRIALQADRTPGTAAIIHSSRTMTYRDLDDAANVLSARLRAVGVDRGAVVGVYLDRSPHTVVALLGIMRAGAAYLPLDPSYPNERLTFMVADSGTAVVVSRLALMSDAATLGATVLPIDAPSTVSPVIARQSITETDTAYLIYTSGSTGRPKGVKISHRNLQTFLSAMDGQFGGDVPGTWLAVTSISFDISVLELLWTLTRGYRVVLRSDEPGSSIRPKSPANIPKPTDFSLYFFGNASADRSANSERYKVVFDAAKFADERGFAAIWTPERHFHKFGGLYPNPSVMAAALSAVTKRVHIRAGSVVLPLHDPIRVAEEWALVDNLSMGRCGVSFASGWQPDDFVLAPDRYADRKVVMMTAIEEVRKLWRGEHVSRRNGLGNLIDIGIFPRPFRSEIPMWITSARHPDTFRMAGEAGVGLLTHLIGHTVEQLSEKISLYREAWELSGHQGRGHVALMLHTFVGQDIDAVRKEVREPLREYIRSSFDLMSGFGPAFEVKLSDLPPQEVEDLLDVAFERFFASSGLLGTPKDVADIADKLASIGVDDLGCLIDFGVGDREVIASLEHLASGRDEHHRRHAAKMSFIEEDDSVAEQITRHGVTHMQCTPSLAGILALDPSSRDAMHQLRRLLVGGEALPPDLAATLAQVVSGSVHNMYGPTEATVWATSSVVDGKQPPSIGTPLQGYFAFVVDAALQPVPIGVPGELILGGEAVSIGYHARPDLTSEKFLPDHLSGNRDGHLYRTGDLVRWQASGVLEFLGRLDNQVKIRGRRIELGEIEAALAGHPAVQQAVCDVRGPPDAKSIVAYLRKAPNQPVPERAELQNFMRQTLPDHMVPVFFLQLDAFPLTPNGKINRRALPEPTVAGSQKIRAFRAPDADLERAIAAVWKEVLRLEEVGVDDNFFDLGGNSVLVVAVRSRLLDRVGNHLSLVDMFRYPTISSLAAAVEKRRSSDGSTSPDIDRATAAAQKRRASMARNIRKDDTGESK
jgi:natural product biosynthesis luciferase-like monooxygenase protein